MDSFDKEYAISLIGNTVRKCSNPTCRAQARYTVDFPRRATGKREVHDDRGSALVGSRFLCIPCLDKYEKNQVKKKKT